jgi:proteic killer suppression protein
VIQSFADATTEDVFNGRATKAARRIPKALWPVARRKLEYLEVARTLGDLAQVPGNRLEALQGDQRGYYSIRVNQQYRITFRFETGTASDVRCWDYHP